MQHVASLIWRACISSGVVSALLQPLSKLAHLQYFHLGQSAHVTSIEPLGDIRQLRWLGLELLSKVREFSVIARLTNLDDCRWMAAWENLASQNACSPRITHFPSVSFHLQTCDLTTMSLAGLFPLTNLAAFHYAYCGKTRRIEEFDDETCPCHDVIDQFCQMRIPVLGRKWTFHYLRTGLETRCQEVTASYWETAHSIDITGR